MTLVTKNRKTGKIILIVLNVLLILGLGFSTGFLYVKYQNLKQKTLSNDQLIAKYEKEISKTFTLPTGEKPTLYVVNKADSLKSEGPNKDFFKDAADGDALLVYEKAKLGVLYRPTTKKIVKTGPASLSQQLSVAVIGAKTDRDQVLAVLKSAFSKDFTTAVEQDPKTPVSGVTVVDLTGKNNALAAKLASELKGTVGSVPVGQNAAPAEASIAVYVGPAVASSAPTATPVANP